MDPWQFKKKKGLLFKDNFAVYVCVCWKIVNVEESGGYLVMSVIKEWVKNKKKTERKIVILKKISTILAACRHQTYCYATILLSSWFLFNKCSNIKYIFPCILHTEFISKHADFNYYSFFKNLKTFMAHVWLDILKCQFLNLQAHYTGRWISVNSCWGETRITISEM